MKTTKTCTDTFNFEKQQLFHHLRKTLPDNISHTQNLIECKDDMLFAWDSTNCNVLALNWRAAQLKTDGSIKYQTLVPTSPIDFAVEKITASHEGSSLALSGSRGVAIVELPNRWGPNGQYKEGKERLLCASSKLDERFLCCNPLVNVLQVRWHPASPKDCHLLVLLSNNTIRVYDEAKCRHIWRIGTTPCALPPTNSTLPYLNSLGDTAIDFAIAPLRVATHNDTFDDTTTNRQQQKTNGNVEWPLIILRGNGNLFVATTGINTEKPRIQGPLSMYPSRRDNFGTDSCALLVLPTNPVTIVIAEPNGKLYHAILVEGGGDECETSFNEVDETVKFDAPEWTVNVLEVVELELGLPCSANTKSHNCPIFLKADVNNDSRYFAYHNMGLHAISIEFISQLERFFECDDTNADGLSLDVPSHVEYIVCTKALDSAKSNPVLGLGLLQSPSGLVVLLGTGQIVSLDIITNPTFARRLANIANGDSSHADTTDASSKLFSDSFEMQIKAILTSKSSQPILKLNQSKDVSPKESLELLIYAFQVLRDQHIAKHDKVRQEIEKRVKILQLLKTQQQQELAQLHAEQQQIRANAERLAEQYEETYDKQQDLVKQLHDLIRSLNLKLPRTAMLEQSFGTHIEKIARATKDLAQNIASAKNKMEKQQIQIASDGTGRTRKICLQERQEKIIKESIANTTAQIDAQMKEIQRVKNVLNI